MRPARHRLWFPVFIAISVVTTALRSTPPQDLVHLDIVVESDTGVLLDNLTQDDFEIRVGGAVRPIERFAVNATLKTLVVIDHSSSADKRQYPDVMRWLARQAQPATPIGVAGLGRRLHVISEFAIDRPTFQAVSEHAHTLPLTERIGPTPIMDAIAAAIELLSATTGRRAILFLTDGRSSGNRLSAADVERHAASGGISVNAVLMPAFGSELFAVMIPGAKAVAAAMSPARLLQPIINASGGGLEIVRNPRTPDPVRSLERIFERLRKTYTLGLTPVRDGQFHKVSVHMKVPGLRVSAPAGYQTR